ncbi:MAG: palindromic element RPE2 domain-containing protein [Rickettsia endosymbiont of Labidopullus appendiculatus]|nr:palindromic element RPE2 domain-containing protein [Rickettsia endosymbiont of Labidopullus appendiculatus]
MDCCVATKRLLTIANSGEFGARNDGATPISNRRATSDDIPNFSSIDYNRRLMSRFFIHHKKIAKKTVNVH